MGEQVGSVMLSEKARNHGFVLRAAEAVFLLDVAG